MMTTFFNMGGYAFYVWGAYALALLVLLWNVLLPLRRERKLLRDLAHTAARAKKSPS
jgi:heme exporter protein D